MSAAAAALCSDVRGAAMATHHDPAQQSYERRKSRGQNEIRGAAQGQSRNTPAALIQMFVRRCDLSLDALAAELRLPAQLLRRWAEHGAPEWLRFALAGVAMRHEVPPTALTWLLDDTDLPAATRSDNHTPRPACAADLESDVERTTAPRPRRMAADDPQSADAAG